MRWRVYKVTGLVTPPRACRASRSAQHFYVNGRYVKNRTMMAALENAYKGTLMQGKYPGAILRVDMPADLVDVNVHPAKTEIRFARESDVFDAVYRTVRAALGCPRAAESAALIWAMWQKKIPSPPRSRQRCPAVLRHSPTPSGLRLHRPSRRSRKSISTPFPRQSTAH